MSGGNDLILTLVFLGLAVFVIIKLRSVLGTRTGFERPPEAIRREMEERQRAAQPQDNVVSFPNAQPNGMRRRRCRTSRNDAGRPLEGRGGARNPARQRP